MEDEEEESSSLESFFELSVAGGDVPRCRVSVLPRNVDGILECAAHEIKALLRRGGRGLTEDEEDALDDGFACVDLNVLTNKLTAWRERLFPSVVPCYAVKCNPDPCIVHWLAKHNHTNNNTTAPVVVGFDCASLHELGMARAELDLAKDANPPQPSHPLIVYANPQRSEHDLRESLLMFPPTEELWMTLDGPEELTKMDEACSEVGRDRATLGLIVRILVPDGSSKVPLGEKFGLDALDEAALPSLVRAANALGFSVIGVSFHCGSGCHDPATYAAALDLAEMALGGIDEIQAQDCSSQQPHAPCKVLDIGGGFPGTDGAGGDAGRFSGMPVAEENPTLQHDNDDDDDGEETAAAIAAVIRPTLDRLQRERNLVLLAEPGRYFVEGSACLVARIYDAFWEDEHPDYYPGDIDDEEEQEGEDEKEESSKAPRRRCYRIAHGCHGVFKDVLLCQERFVPHPLEHASLISNTTQKDAEEQPRQLVPSVVRGPSGDPLDVVCSDCSLPLLRTGDWLVFDRMGAYTFSIASRTGRPVIRFVRGGGRVEPVLPP